jgi:hypothetical protein
MAKPGFQGRGGFFRRAGVGLAATILVVGVLRFPSPAVCAAENPPTVSDVKATYAEGLTRLKGVFGVGVGEKDGEEALVILVRDAASKTYLEKLIRDTIEGHPVVITVAQQPGALRSNGSPSGADACAGFEGKTRRTPAVSEDSRAGRRAS